VTSRSEQGASGGAGAERTGAAAAPKSRRRQGRGQALAWLTVLPFFLVVAVFFFLPAGVIFLDAFRATDPDTQTTRFTLDNLQQATRGGYRTAFVGSIQLSAVTAVLGTALGLLLAQAIVTAPRNALLRRLVLTASGVLANFGGVPLAFAFIATIGNAGVVTALLKDNFGIELGDAGFSLYSFVGLALVYLYFLIPLMVLVIVPALDGLRPQWNEAAQNLGATRWQYWRYVGGPVLAPPVLGAMMLLFCGAFAAFATAAAMVGSTVPLVTLQISDVLSGNVLAGQENVGKALGVGMFAVIGVLMTFYVLLQRRTSRWFK